MSNDEEVQNDDVWALSQRVELKSEFKRHIKHADGSKIESIVKELGYVAVKHASRHLPSYTIHQRQYKRGSMSIIYEKDGYQIKFSAYKNGMVPMMFIDFHKIK